MTTIPEWFETSNQENTHNHCNSLRINNTHINDQYQFLIRMISPFNHQWSLLN